MRGKLKVPVGTADFYGRSRDSTVESTGTSADNEERALPVRRLAPWVAGAIGILVASSALPQGNIDAGKSPAQLFADTCSNCHRRASELKRASAGFLRQHYTPGAQEAAAMATYLASIPADPRGGKDKAKAAPQEKEKAKAPPHQQQVQERPPERPPERPKALPPAGKGKRPELGKAEPPVEVPPEAHIETVTVPKLEPFEE